MGSSSKEETAKEADTSNDDASPSNGGGGGGGVMIFTEGERVLAYHGPCVYEAKIQKAELRKKELKYFVHYLGWNKNWDEWVSAERLLKHTEENVKKQKSLANKQRISKSGRPAHSKAKNLVEPKMDKEDAKTNVARGKKRKTESGNEKDNSPLMEKLIKIQVPPPLKKQLVDDWEFVTRKDKLVELPRSPTVDDILTKYLEYRTKKDVMISDSVSEILKGIRCYFDKALSVLLLYNKERKQYEDAVVDEVSPSTVYGAEHLLRLFVKLPELLAYVNIEDEASSHLQQILMDLLKFLQKNQKTFFHSAYGSVEVSEVKGKGKDD